MKETTMDSLTDGEQGDSYGVGGGGSKPKDKGVMNVDSRVVIVGGAGYKGNKWS